MTGFYDTVGSAAKNIHRPDSETKDLMAKITTKYAPKILKKLNAAPNDSVRAVIAGTANMSMQVIARLYGVSESEIIMGAYIYCKDEGYRFISRYFESALELAAINPDKFVASLHSFYNDFASKLRKNPENMLAFMQFADLFVRLRYYNAKGVNPNIVAAYTDLLLQTFEYLRLDKYDTSVSVIGVSLSGEPICRKTKYSMSVLAEWAAATHGLKDKKLGENGFELIFSMYEKYGIPNINSREDVSELFRRQRIVENQKAILSSYINEYTLDIFPDDDDMFYAYPTRFQKLMSFELDDDALIDALMHRRRRTLPTNGVRVQFEDSTEYFKTLLLRETMVHDDTVTMLFRLDTEEGALCGLFRPIDGFFYCPFIDSVNDTQDAYKMVRRIVLYFYGVNTLDDPAYTDEKFESLYGITFFGFSSKAKSYGMGGTPKNLLHPNDASSTGVRAGSDRYEAKEHLIAPMVRKLPAGHKASAEAQERAKSLGYDLKLDETFVSPHIRTVYSLRHTEEHDDKGKGENDKSESN